MSIYYLTQRPPRWTQRYPLWHSNHRPGEMLYATTWVGDRRFALVVMKCEGTKNYCVAYEERDGSLRYTARTPYGEEVAGDPLPVAKAMAQALLEKCSEEE